MKNSTHLYLLCFPKKKMVKIGKADDIHNRIRTLQRYWGDVDYAASYFLPAPTETVFKLEKSLHFLLSPFAISFDTGDGKTELFSEGALEVALQYIDLYLRSTPQPSTIQQGVALPIPQESESRRRKNHAALIRRSKEVAPQVIELAKKFDRIQRLLLLLLRRQTRYEYEYDILENKIVFRIRLDKLKIKRLFNHDLMLAFSFGITDLRTSSWRNCCSITARDDIIQYNIMRPSESGSQSYHPLLDYFMTQSEILLKKLPTRSAAVSSSIPPLDESNILSSIIDLAHHG
jgi:T5orf172 domain